MHLPYTILGKFMTLREILELLAKGNISLDEAEAKIKLLTLEKIGEKIQFDVGREFRIGIPEIILAEYKDANSLKKAILKIVEKYGRAIVSRLRSDQISIIEDFKEKYDVYLSHTGRIAVIKRKNYKIYRSGGKIGIITAGTADVPVAEEVKTIAEELGCKTYTIYDAGIAGLHRTVEALKVFHENNVDVIVAIAGMEGALPSVIKSLTELPVIGLPTSKGYGLGGSGQAALLSMLQSCTPGLVVVNIDNSVGAAVAAVSIAQRVAKFRRGDVD